MLLEILIIGALMGILGQGARAVVGLKGMSDDAKAQGLSPSDLFEAARLLTSFLIGTLVGLASALVYFKNGGSMTENPTWQIMLAWAVSAYAGTDFLEGFISQYLSTATPTPTVKLHTASIEALTTKIALKTPTYSKAQATKIVLTAFNALNKPDVIPSNTLGNPPISFNSSGYTGLYVQINNAINDIRNEFVQDIIGTWSDKTTVCSIIKQVMYAPTGTSA
jgi:hypothetical protein